MRDRNKQKQEWLDYEFSKKLKALAWQKAIKDGKKPSIANLSRLILECPSFKNVEQEILNNDLKITFKIKLDKKNMFR